MCCFADSRCLLFISDIHGTQIRFVRTDIRDIASDVKAAQEMGFVIKLLAIVIVLPVLATPVPPFDPGKILEIVPEESAYFEVSAVNE